MGLGCPPKNLRMLAVAVIVWSILYRDQRERLLLWRLPPSCKLQPWSFRNNETRSNSKYSSMY